MYYPLTDIQADFEICLLDIKLPQKEIASNYRWIDNRYFFFEKEKKNTKIGNLHKSGLVRSHKKP